MRREQSVTGFKQMEKCYSSRSPYCSKRTHNIHASSKYSPTNKRVGRKTTSKRRTNSELASLLLYQVQDTEEDLTTARINESNALLDYQRALVKLIKAKGTYLEEIQKYGISLK